MARIGGMALIVLALFSLVGCSDKTTANEPTGISISFAHCLSLPMKVRIDNSYIGTYSTDHVATIETSTGNHTLEVDAIGFCVADSTFLWNTSVTVSSGQLTQVQLDCYGNGYRPCQ
jgi:hypothetical protein